MREKFPPEAASDLDRPFELAEVEAALWVLPTDKVPGYDRHPLEFYVTFWKILGRDFLSGKKECMYQGFWGLDTAFQERGKYNLGNYRPITLLCADYKVAAHVLAGRLRKGRCSLGYNFGFPFVL